MTEHVEIFTDGACRGNPGPGGWGALLRHGGHEKQMHGGERETTNNRMELTAAIMALEWITNWKKRGWKNSARKPVKNADLWMRLDEVAAKHDIEWHWVKGHSGHDENELADQLANRGIDELG